MSVQRLVCLMMVFILLPTGCGAESSSDPSELVGTTTTTVTTEESRDSSNAATTGDAITEGGQTTTDGDGTTIDKTTETTTTTPTTTTALNGGVSMEYEFFRLGDGLVNTYWKLKNEKKLNVAFMGGSVTYGNGCDDLSQSFRFIVTDWLQEQFPDATITQINAAFPCACSAYGAYAVDDWVIAKEADLVFLEFGVNDKYARSRYTIDQVKANYETILRKLYRADATCDVVALYTTDADCVMEVPLYEQVAAQEEVAQYYGIPSINIGWQLRNKYSLIVKTTKWYKFFADGVHATATGNQGYGKIITDCLSKAFKAAESSGVAQVRNKVVPAAKSNDLLMNTKYVKVDALDLPAGWSLAEKGEYPLASAGTVGGELTYTFTGTALSLFINGTNITLEYSVDGGPVQSQRVTGSYHLPLPIVSGLENKQHTITIKAPTEVFRLRAILIRQ